MVRSSTPTLAAAAARVESSPAPRSHGAASVSTARRRPSFPRGPSETRRLGCPPTILLPLRFSCLPHRLLLPGPGTIPQPPTPQSAFRDGRGSRGSGPRASDAGDEGADRRRWRHDYPHVVAGPLGPSARPGGSGKSWGLLSRFADSGDIHDAAQARPGAQGAPLRPEVPCGPGRKAPATPALVCHGGEGGDGCPSRGS